MNKCIVDTSVVIKWYSQENDRERAIRLLELNEKDKIGLVFPQEAVTELVNVLYFGKKFTHKECFETIKSFLSLQAELIGFQDKIIKKTIGIVYKNRIASYDALFIAIAENLNIPLITADYKHHRKIFSPKITWLSEWNGKI